MAISTRPGFTRYNESPRKRKASRRRSDAVAKRRLRDAGHGRLAGCVLTPAASGIPFRGRGVTFARRAAIQPAIQPEIQPEILPEILLAMTA
ncbi:MAG: hypothetical protein RIS70_4221 [Planctomycetota bacterium]